MKNYKKISSLLFLAILLFTHSISAQTPYAAEVVKKDNLKNIDWFVLNYQYIDKDYNVTIDSATFQQACVTYNLPAVTMTTYTDSVAVAMMLEFGDWDIANKAISKVGYSWTKMSYYLWKTPKETKAIAASFGLNHAYKFRAFFSNADNKDPKVIALIDEVKAKLTANNLTEFNELSRKDFMTYAYKHNPVKNAFYAKKRAEKKRLMEQNKKKQ